MEFFNLFQVISYVFFHGDIVKGRREHDEKEVATANGILMEVESCYAWDDTQTYNRRPCKVLQ
jgi:hypothetical protein